MKGSARLERHVTLPRPNARYDDLTPPCTHCEEPHVGFHTEVTVMLRGQFVLNGEQGVAMFVLDPSADVAGMVLPNGQLALVFEPGPAVKAAHDECVEQVLTEVGLAGLDEEEEDLDEEETDEDEYEGD